MYTTLYVVVVHTECVPQYKIAESVLLTVFDYDDCYFFVTVTKCSKLSTDTKYLVSITKFLRIFVNSLHSYKNDVVKLLATRMHMNLTVKYIAFNYEMIHFKVKNDEFL